MTEDQDAKAVRYANLRADLSQAGEGEYVTVRRAELAHLLAAFDWFTDTMLDSAGIDLTGMDAMEAVKLGGWTFDQLQAAWRRGHEEALELIRGAGARQVVMNHQRLTAGQCACGWGARDGNWGRSHARHVADQMAAYLEATWTPAKEGDTPGALVPGEGDVPPAVNA